jgi:chromosomal replication initiator protein
MREIWNQVQRRLETRLGAQAHDIWIRPIRLVALDGKVARLEVPNRYYSDWIRDNYEHDLLEELSTATGQDLILEFLFQAPEPVAEELTGSAAVLDEVASSSRPRLMADKTFDNFVVGSCNKFAHAASLAVADFPGTHYNPLFIYGDTGLGKTHLLHSIGNAVRAQNPAARVVYTTTEVFVNQLINALRFKKMEEFRNTYRQTVDCLIIDDIQFLSGKDRSQEEFFHTFQALQGSGRQIIITADVLPKEIDKLEPRLRSRFEGGLLADIQPPDLETMVAILRKKADELNIPMPDDVSLWVAGRVRCNIREAEGALKRLGALSSFFSTDLDIEFCKEHLAQLYPERTTSPTPDRVMEVVARFFNIRVTDLKGRRKVKGIARPRQIAMHLTRVHTELSFPDIGRAFGGRDHSTVQYACKKVKSGLNEDPDLREVMRNLENSLGV